MNQQPPRSALSPARLVTTLFLVQGMVLEPSRYGATAFGTQSATRIRPRDSSCCTQLFAASSQRSKSRPTTRTIDPLAEEEQQRRRRRRPREARNKPIDYYSNKSLDEEGEEDDEFLHFEVDSFQELKRSTGSEILDDQLQSQIDMAAPTPNKFLDAHVTDATFIEKIAMGSVPEQLPQPAVDAFRQQQQLKKKKQQNPKKSSVTNARRKRTDLEFPTAERVSPEEEIELAKMIQRGVWLHKLKTDQEAQNGKPLGKNEWAKLAGIETATQLRREVATYRRAKQLLVSANMGLVHTVVKKNYYDTRSRSGVTFEELVQEGSLGLLRAAELFDPARGIRFSTYATIWIKGTLSNSHALDGAIKLPSREKEKWKKIVKAHREIVLEKGGTTSNTYGEASLLSSSANSVSAVDIANRLDMKVEDVIVFQRKMKQAKSVLSLDYEYKQQSRGGNESGGDQQLLMNMDDKSIQADTFLAERTQMQADVIAAMARNLTPREARLMRLRYGLTTDGKTRTIQECADAMGVSQARASQLAKACLQKLREAAEAESLEEYLLTIA